MVDPQAFDAEFEVVGDSPGNLLSFPDLSNTSATPRQHPCNNSATPAQPLRNGCATAAQLAEIADITRQQWQRDWYSKFCEIVAIEELRDGRAYTPLCEAMTRSLLDAKANGMSPSAWVTRIGRPQWGRVDEPIPPSAVVDVQSLAIVPSSCGLAVAQQSNTLAVAQGFKGFAAAFLDRLSDGLISHDVESTATASAIAHAAIAADEMIKIAKEQQVRAQVRADFEARQQAAAAAVLAQQMQQLQGGGNV
jgi:hypothetical protein